MEVIIAVLGAAFAVGGSYAGRHLHIPPIEGYEVLAPRAGRVVFCENIIVLILG